ncbi:Hypothetical_protein [Hexamita inflata]|uniref:Hypothetical_protein n=1 Tax=Hexamita inflata TaxID=28002 RepID=A0AA86NZZ5_9EUKA|nr:Hypothetical protein HINF_LOCUS16148 [Hexamita inflata]
MTTAYPRAFQMQRYCHVRAMKNDIMFSTLRMRVQRAQDLGYVAANKLGLNQNRWLLNADSLLPCIREICQSARICTRITASWPQTRFNKIYILGVSPSFIRVQAAPDQFGIMARTPSFIIQLQYKT